MTAITTYPIVLVLTGLVTLASLGYLLFHARDVVALFARRDNDLVAGRARHPGASKGAIWAALIVFNAAWVAMALVWSFTAASRAGDREAGASAEQTAGRLPHDTQ